MQTTAAPANAVKRPRISGSKIEQVRLDRGMTATELAAAVGRCERAVRAWEVRDAQPHRETVPRIAAALGVTVDDLLA